MTANTPIPFDTLSTPTFDRRAPRAVTSERQKLVLVAEDDPHLLHTILCLMQQLGVQCVGASSGDEMLGWLEPLMLQEDRGCSPDVVLTDIVMPGVGALEVVEGLAYAARYIPVIVVSGVEDPAVRARVKDLGCPFVAKPVNALELEAQVRLALAASYARTTF